MLDQLKTLNPDGQPPETRIARAKDAYEIWNQLRMADAVSSFERARWQAMYDNVPPLNQNQLDANGQGYRVNVSWGLAPMVLDMAQSGYIDMISATETFFECPTTYDVDPDQRKEFEEIIAEEVTACIRSWEDFMETFLRNTSTFIKEAVSIVTFDDEWDWRFDAKGLSDFKIPRKTKVGQSNVDVACWLRFYSATQLYQFIKYPETAEANGWDVKAVQQAIIQSVNNANTFRQWQTYEWEKLEVELRNNDYFWTYGVAQTQNIRVVHVLWQEFDGRMSSGIICDSPEQTDWLCHKVGRYEKTYNAFVMYTYGVGNDYYHGIRGQGYIIYPIVGALNRAYSQLLEVGMYGSAPIIHVKDESDMQTFQFQPCGAYTLVGGDVAFVGTSMVTNLSKSVMPIINGFTQMFREQTANANTQSLIESPKEMTAAEVNARLGSIAKMSSSSLSLFYDPWESTLREMVRRMKRRDYGVLEAGGSYIVELHKKLLKRGGKELLEAFFNLDTTRLRAKRAIGSGSEAARLLAFNQLMQVLPYLPEGGRQNVIRDFVAGYVSWRNADRYTGQSTSATTNAQESIAWAQNTLLMGSQFQPVLPNDDHFVHARVHSEMLAPVTQQTDQTLAQISEADGGGQPVDLNPIAQQLQGLQTLAAHFAEHVEKIAINPAGQKLVGQYKQILQQASEIIWNGTQQVQKMMQKQDESAMQEQGQQPMGPDPQVVSKIQEQQALTDTKVQAIQATTAAKLEANQKLADQKLVIEDAKGAQQIRQQAQKARVQRREVSV